ncbi:MAG TPA: branched-chain amino acid ABC transporter permease [Caldimonas sp.]|jgi:urea transport system permease protein|nr:branched-chain amino acid ABC transporter permease [Caldimonas sp.]
MDPASFVAPALNALFGIASLAIVALGLAVVLGLLGVLNLAHGELVMVGAYCAYVAQSQGWPYLAAVPLALALCALLGWSVERWLVRPLYQRPFDTLVLTWGLSLLLRKSAEAIFGLGYKSLTEPIGGTLEVLGTSYPRYRLLLIATAAVVLGALFAWYRRSRTGTRIQAMVGNPDLARALGLPVRRYASATFVAGTCLAGLAGVLIAPLVPVQPFMGLDYILMSFFVLVVGGLGSLAGLSTGSALIGGVNSAVSALSDSTGGYLSVLVIAILFLWLRPRGIHAR